jgi:23S rRNA (uracil1939-C5)-methyltransferase
MFRAIPIGEKWGKEFISWDTCPMHIEGIQATLPKLREALLRAAPGKIAETLFGVWIGSPHVVVIAKESFVAELRAIDWPTILCEPLRQVWFHQTNQVGRSTFGEGPIVPIIGEAVLGAPPIRAFRQISQTLLEHARKEAVSALLAESPTAILDLYCGTGEIALRLPAHIGWIGIEASKDASAFAGALRVDGEVPHAAFTGFVEHRLRDTKVLARIPDSYSLYLNPPRPGLGESGRELLVDLIRARRPKSVVYLSCSASSLARDLPALESVGMKILRLLPYDFFPQTEHFETLAILKA